MTSVLRTLAEGMARRVDLTPWLVSALFLSSACGGVVAPTSSPAELALRAWLDGKPGTASGTLVLQAVLPQGLSELPVPEPRADGLEIALDDMSTERLGDRQVFTWRYEFSGPKGSYEIEPVVLEVPGESDEFVALSTTSLFVDMGAEPPRSGELVDIVDPTPVTEIPYMALLGLSAAGVLGAAGIWVAFGRVSVRRAEEVPPEAPDVAALRRWEGIRADGGLDDFEKARALSEIFRAYAEAVLQFPASAWTTTQIVGRLRSMPHLPEGNVARARRLLRATDRVKYAELRPGQDFFEDLEADLRAFIGTTRPRSWEDEGA